MREEKEENTWAYNGKIKLIIYIYLLGPEEDYAFFLSPILHTLTMLVYIIYVVKVSFIERILHMHVYK